MHHRFKVGMILASNISTGIFLFKSLEFIKDKEQNLDALFNVIHGMCFLESVNTAVSIQFCFWLQKEKNNNNKNKTKKASNLILCGKKD